MPELYPVFLNLADKNCLIAGFGDVGQRKLEGLLKCVPAHILVLDLHEPAQHIKEKFLSSKIVEFIHRSWKISDLNNCFLVFACTNDKNINLSIARACAQKNIICNCATEPENGSAIIPARAKQGLLEAAISTSGASPLYAAHLRYEIEKWLMPKNHFAVFLKYLREEILAISSNSLSNREFFQKILNSNIEEWLKNKNLELCRNWLLANGKPLNENNIDRILTKMCHELS